MRRLYHGEAVRTLCGSVGHSRAAAPERTRPALSPTREAAPEWAQPALSPTQEAAPECARPALSPTREAAPEWAKPALSLTQTDGSHQMCERNSSGRTTVDVT